MHMPSDIRRREVVSKEVLFKLSFMFFKYYFITGFYYIIKFIANN